MHVVMVMVRGIVKQQCITRVSKKHIERSARQTFNQKSTLTLTPALAFPRTPTLRAC